MAQLDAPLPAGVSVVRRLLPFLDEDVRVNACCVVGSQVAGLGTPTSDLDLYVFASDQAAADALAMNRARMCDGIRVDIEFYPLPIAHGFVDQCAEFQATMENSRQLYAVEQALKFIGILTSGCVVLRDSSEFAELRDRLKTYHRSFRQLAAARAELFANNIHEDVIGFLRA
ncbi:MAG TPA: nucleotidyltransferase domain-containing protein, partial [Pilimelia sp.]|nr:nucleotidyltransferase domain-containing protein [Pilimelia sp.]